MLRPRLLLLLFGALTAAIPPSFGFIVERSADVPTSWNVAPSLEIDQKVAVEPTLNAKMRVTRVDDLEQVDESRKSVRQIGEKNSEETRDKEWSLFVGDAMNDTELVKLSEVKSTSQKVTTFSLNPRNIILLLVEEKNPNREDFWRDFKVFHYFPVEGFLQSCRRGELGSLRFSLDDAFVYSSKDNECECEHLLSANIGSLLSWARHVREMTTATVSGTNFTIPVDLEYERSQVVTRGFEESDENSAKPEVRKIKPEIRTGWHLINLGESTNHASSLVDTPNANEEGATNYESMWNVLDTFARIRMVLFRTLLESLGGRAGAAESVFSPGKPHPLQSNLPDLVGNTIKELKSGPNERGYVLVVAASGNELAPIMALLQTEMSAGDTLMVVTEMCSHDGKPVQFLAKGPAAKKIREGTMVWDIPTVIRDAAVSGCHGKGCRTGRHYQLRYPFLPLKAMPRNVPSYRRLARDMQPAEKQVNGNKNATEPILQSEASDNKNTTMKKGADGTAAEITAGKLTVILGIAASALTTLVISAP